MGLVDDEFIRMEFKHFHSTIGHVRGIDYVYTTTQILNEQSGYVAQLRNKV